MADEHLVLRLHEAALERSGGTPGVLSLHELRAALARPFAGFGDHIEYPTVHEKAAVVAHGIARGHPFVDANKRTALLAAAAWLDSEGLRITASATASTAVMLDLAEGRLAVRDFARWLREHSAPSVGPAGGDVLRALD